MEHWPLLGRAGLEAPVRKIRGRADRGVGSGQQQIPADLPSRNRNGRLWVGCKPAGANSATPEVGLPQGGGLILGGLAGHRVRPQKPLWGGEAGGEWGLLLSTKG